MKKATITLSYDDEKLSALRIYLSQKGQTLENELITSIDTLYGKAVPANVREFIELSSVPTKTADKKKAQVADSDSVKTKEEEK